MRGQLVESGKGFVARSAVRGQAHALLKQAHEGIVFKDAHGHLQIVGLARVGHGGASTATGVGVGRRPG